MNERQLEVFYRALLFLYPRCFREEFGEEMLSVFTQTAIENKRAGLTRQLKVVLQEVIDLPAAVLQAHEYTRREWDRQTLRELAGEQSNVGMRELLAALAAFLIPVILLLANAGSAISAALAFLALALMIGLLRGLPRWSFLYLGLALANAGALFFFSWGLEQISPVAMSQLAPAPGDESARLIMQAFTTGLLWLCLFVITFLILGLLSLLRRFRRTYWRIRNDWSLASFILYGEAVFMMVLMFAEYRNEQPYALSAIVLFAAGACFYLRRPGRWPRVVWLVSGITLAMVIAAAGRWSLFSRSGGGDWPGWLMGSGGGWAELGHALIEWAWMLLALLLPAWLQLFEPKHREQAGG